MKLPCNCQGFKACGEEVRIVQNDVLDAGLRQRTRERRLPNPLGNPRPARFGAEVLAKVIRQLAELRDLVGIRNGR